MINENEDVIVTLYSFDEHGAYCGLFEYNWAKGTGLASNTTLKTPPVVGSGFVAVFNGDSWDTVPDNFGKTAYKKSDGSPIKIDFYGEPTEDLTFDEPIPHGVWVDGSWVDIRSPEEIAEDERKSMPDLSPMQFDLKLHNAGLLQTVRDYVASNEVMNIAYSRATFFRRTDPFIIQAQSDLNLTDKQVDEIWVAE